MIALTSSTRERVQLALIRMSTYEIEQINAAVSSENSRLSIVGLPLHSGIPIYC
jgi:hypothetical protein